MSKNMNKRFFSEFLALLSLKVNPDPDAEDDAEIDIVKQIFAHSQDSASAPDMLSTKFPDDSSVDFYDEEESTGSCSSSCKETAGQGRDTRSRWGLTDPPPGQELYYYYLFSDTLVQARRARKDRRKNCQRNKNQLLPELP